MNNNINSIKNIFLFLRSFIKVFFLKLFYYKNFRFNSIISVFIGPGSNITFSKKNSRLIADSFKIRRNVFININGGTLEMGKDVFFNNGCSINCQDFIKIGDNSLFGENVLIYDHDHKFNLNNDLVSELGYVSRKIIIDSNVWVGSNVVILKGVSIGKNSVIAAGSIVSKDIPENSLFFQSRISNFKRL